MTGATQNWAMPILQALDEGRHHELLTNYDAFRDAVIDVYGELDRKSTAEDRLGRIMQTGSMASYISTFNEHVAQVEWNEASLVERFRAGLKDEILDSIATAEAQYQKLHEWMAMASRIDEQLWSRCQGRRPPNLDSHDHTTRSQANPTSFEPVPMEVDAIRGTKRVTTALAKTPAERLKYQRQGKCWGCGRVGHIHSNCPTNPSKPMALLASEKETRAKEQGKGGARD